jgi:hypothetical protein
MKLIQELREIVIKAKVEQENEIKKCNDNVKDWLAKYLKNEASLGNYFTVVTVQQMLTIGESADIIEVIDYFNKEGILVTLVEGTESYKFDWSVK